MGNGSYIRILEDPWISKKRNYKPIWVKESLKGERVADLIDDDGAWKDAVIRENFIQADA